MGWQGGSGWWESQERCRWQLGLHFTSFPHVPSMQSLGPSLYRRGPQSLHAPSDSPQVTSRTPRPSGGARRGMHLSIHAHATFPTRAIVIGKSVLATGSVASRISHESWAARASRGGWSCGLPTLVPAASGRLSIALGSRARGTSGGPRRSRRARPCPCTEERPERRVRQSDLFSRRDDYVQEC